MKYDEFVSRVRARGEHLDRTETERVIQLVLSVLGQRLGPDEAEDLAAQLPLPAGAWLTGHREPPVSFGVPEFLARVAAGNAGTEVTARRDAGMVLATVAEATSGGELDDVLARLPEGFAVFFGRPGPTG